MRTIDLNADVGEGFATDADLIPLVTSANIACGGHAGDKATMRAATVAAIEAGVAIGAHPGHEDREHFGRRELPIDAGEVVALLNRQVDRLHAIVAGLGGSVSYLKPHGGLYHQAHRDPVVAEGVVRFLEAFHTPLALLGLAGGELQRAADRADVPFYAEAFADRAYLADGSLAPRSEPGAVFTETAKVVDQAVALASDGPIRTLDGGEMIVRCDSICLHGDGLRVVARANAVRRGLRQNGVALRAFGA